MATTINMQHPQTGVQRRGLYGFSWTTLFFAGIPALFRGDIITGLVVTILGVMTWQISSVIWAFFYNKKYTISLIEKGYVFVGGEQEVIKAKAALGIY